MGREAEEGFWRTFAKQLGSNFGHQTEWYQGEMCVRWSFRNRIWPSKPCQPSVIETYIYSLWELCERLWTICQNVLQRRRVVWQAKLQSDWLDFQSLVLSAVINRFDSDRNRPVTVDKLYTSLSSNTITAKLTSQFQPTRHQRITNTIYLTPDDFRSG